MRAFLRGIVLATTVGVGVALSAGVVSAVADPVSTPLYSDCATVSANLVVNCGFEDGGFDGPNGWTETPASRGSEFGPSVYAHSGTFAMQFAATAGFDDEVSQTIAGTQPGQTYVLSYWLDVEGDGNLNHFEVTVGNVQGGGTQTFDDLTNVGPFGWTYYQDSFVAGASAPVLTFAVSNAPSYTHLDDVAIEAGPLSQTVSFTSVAPTNAVPGNTYLATATGGSSGEPIVFATDPKSVGCAVSLAGTVTFTGPGMCRINASQAAAAGFNAATTVQQRIIVNRWPQTIVFTSTPPVHPVPGTQYTVTATGGGSGNPVIISTTSGSVCTTTSDGVVSFLAAGRCVIAANQAASSTYAKAPTVRQNVVVYRH